MLFGSDEQKKEWLPKVARTHISAFLLTEPDVGSDPARLSVTATPSRGRLDVPINGTKLWATNGAFADVVDRDGDGAQERGAPRRDHRVHRAHATARA